MVDDRAVERFGGAGQSPRRPAIGTARPRVAARVVVRKDDSGAVMTHRVGKNLANREYGAGFVARMPRDMQAAGLIVEMRDPDAFKVAFGIGQAAREEGAGGSESVKFQRKFGTLVSHDNRIGVLARSTERNRIHYELMTTPFWR